MSEDEQVSDTVTAEFRDGQLQIVEVSPYEKGDEIQTEETVEHILPDNETPSTSRGQREVKHYVQVLDTGGKGLMQLDLLNFTLVRCNDGAQPEFRLVANGDESTDGGSDEATVTCVLRSDDEEQEESYVMMDGQSPLVILQSDNDEPPTKKSNSNTQKKTTITKAELLEKTKAALQNIKPPQPGKRRRKRTADFPPPHELLASPNFKLYLYSCKLCSFKCNAIKELAAHKASEHVGCGARWRVTNTGRTPSNVLQCARCPYRAASQAHLMCHFQDKHVEDVVTTEQEAEEPRTVTVDVLVCGACGYESTSKSMFKTHIQTVHSTT